MFFFVPSYHDVYFQIFDLHLRPLNHIFSVFYVTAKDSLIYVLENIINTFLHNLNMLNKLLNYFY